MIKYIAFLLLTFGLSFSLTAQAQEHYDEKLNTLYEVENILELIATLDADTNAKGAQRDVHKQQLKKLAIQKIRSI